jgi:hypothetical protein
VGCLRPAGASRGHDTHRRHAMAPGLVGETIEQAAGHPGMRPVRSGAKATPAICGQLPWARWRAGQLLAAAVGRLDVLQGGDSLGLALPCGRVAQGRHIGRIWAIVAGGRMANTIEQLPSGLTIGHAQLGMHGRQQGTINQHVHDGDTVVSLLEGNTGIRFLGVDAPEVSFTLPGHDGFIRLSNPAWETFLTDPFAPGLPPLPALVRRPAGLPHQRRLGYGRQPRPAGHRRHHRATRPGPR